MYYFVLEVLMGVSSITSKGQVTIPAEIRRLLHLSAGKKVKFSCENNVVTLTPVENDINAVFGLLKASKTVSMEDMDKVIATAACDD